MRIRIVSAAVGGLVAALTLGAITARENQEPKRGNPAAKTAPPADDRPGDREAIVNASRAFGEAVEKRDAKAVAAFWTENGEYHDADGTTIRGRADIEKAFTEFFKLNPHRKMEVMIETIRFPSRDTAIEEGIIRTVNSERELPATTLYSVMHVREDGVWRMAVAREWGDDQDRLEDVEWLAGTWKASSGGRDTTLTFSWDKAKPFMLGTFTTTEKGKSVASGNLKIGLDAQRNQLRSWHFDDDGGHGQALWIRDGNRWVLDSIGVLGDGAETASVTVVARVNHNEITWRSIDRVIGGAKAPDTIPIKLTRVAAQK